jgi:hypothetical protein
VDEIHSRREWASHWWWWGVLARASCTLGLRLGWGINAAMKAAACD